MAFGGFEPRERAAPMADINMTPLIDVMLVLLVIFIITAPLFTHSIGLELPRAEASPANETPATVTVAIDKAGRLYWDTTPVSADALREKLASAGRAASQPDIELRADQATPYRLIAEVMAAAQQAGLSHLGFVVEQPGSREQAPRGAPQAR